MTAITKKLRDYWPLIKSLQTGLLVTTGLAGYMSVRCPVFNMWTMVGLFISLFLSISGSTILNMWWDRDIDARDGAHRRIVRLPPVKFRRMRPCGWAYSYRCWA